MTVELTDRFWSKISKDPGTDCWNWTGALNSRGYGQWGVNKVSKSTHRLAYEALVGPIPDGLTIDHLCRNKRCCNPAHLEPVTQAVNNERAKAVILRCPAGHAYTRANTVLKRGRRSCRECFNSNRRRDTGRTCSTKYAAKRRASVAYLFTPEAEAEARALLFEIRGSLVGATS